jgi:hypothetical protein
MALGGTCFPIRSISGPASSMVAVVVTLAAFGFLVWLLVPTKEKSEQRLRQIPIPVPPFRLSSILPSWLNEELSA